MKGRVCKQSELFADLIIRMRVYKEPIPSLDSSCRGCRFRSTMSSLHTPGRSIKELHVRLQRHYAIPGRRDVDVEVYNTHIVREPSRLLRSLHYLVVSGIYLDTEVGTGQYYPQPLTYTPPLPFNTRRSNQPNHCPTKLDQFCYRSGSSSPFRAVQLRYMIATAKARETCSFC